MTPSENITHVYMMPGMAANPTIFEFIELPEENYKTHWLEWQMPEPNESLKAYAKRMCQSIKEENVVLIGVSFGGMLVQEMSAFLKTKKIIVISSIKSYHELPKHLKMLRLTKAYKILPTQLIRNVDLLAKFALGETVRKRIDLYKKYLSVNDKKYLDWAIKEVVCWQQDKPLKDAVYIIGDNDQVFPNSCQGDCITIKGGTHIMIINRFKWFNENLPLIIEDKFEA